MGMCFKRPMLDTKRKFGVVQKSEGNDVDPKKVRKLNESDPKDLSGTEFQDNSKSTHKNEKDKGYSFDRFGRQSLQQTIYINGNKFQQTIHMNVLWQSEKIERQRIRVIQQASQETPEKNKRKPIYNFLNNPEIIPANNSYMVIEPNSQLTIPANHQQANQDASAEADRFRTPVKRKTALTCPDA